MKMALALGTLALAAGAAQASIVNANGYRVDARVFNDFGGSNLTINGVNYAAPGSGAIASLDDGVHIIEQFPQFIPGNFANKHVAWFSEDNGVSRTDAKVGESFQLNFCVTMIAPAGAPRKEAGLEIHQNRPNHNPPYNDEGQLLIASDGEVALFGAVMPFTGFGNNTYTLGTTAYVQFTYYAPGDLGPMAAYRLTFNDAVTGMHDSGYKFWGVESDGINGLTDAFLGFKDQNQRNPFIADSIDLTYDCVKIVPAPGAAGLLGLGGLVAMRRRRA